MISNSLILPHMNYSLLAWGANCHSIELLQKGAYTSENGSPLGYNYFEAIYCCQWCKTR